METLEHRLFVVTAMSPAVKAEKSKTNRAIDAQLQFADQELRRHAER